MPKQKWEEEAKDHFLAFLEQARGEKWNVIDSDVVVDAASGRNFDYQLAQNGKRIALEIFRLIEDQEDLGRQRVWSEVVHALKDELANRGIREYLIDTPSSFRVAKVNRKTLVKELGNKLEEVIKANAKLGEFEAEGFRFNRVEGLKEVVFSTFGKGGAVNPPGIALSALLDKLPDKNDQLQIQVHDRTILVINWAYIVGLDEVIEACSQINFNEYPNIDKLFFESSPGKINLVFDRMLFEAFEKLAAPPSEGLEPLYIQWLGCRLGRKDRKAFDLVKKLAIERGNMLWLPVPGRVEVVRYGDEFVNAGDWDNVLWIVRSLRHDPDPQITKDSGDLHQLTLRGEDTLIISTVRGHLCWLLQKIVAHNRTDLYPEIVEIVGEYAFEENLYIRQQATVPLIELVRRRLARQAGGEPFMGPKLSERLGHVAFEILRENTSFPLVLKRVAMIFVWLRDLDAKDAQTVIGTFLRYAPDHAGESIAVLLIYFALFRKRQFEDHGPFDEEPLGRLLQYQLSYGTERVRSFTIWEIWKLLRQKEITFQEVEAYVVAVPNGPYNSSAFHHFYEITSKFMADSPDSLRSAFRSALRRENEFIKSNPQEVLWHFDTTWDSLQQIFDASKIDCFLDCVETVLEYRNRIQMPPDALFRELLGKVNDPEHKPRAIALLDKLARQQQ